MSNWILPDWPAPANVRAISTTRLGGVSLGTYASFNLAEHVNDDPDHVIVNRDRLATDANLPCEPRWISQVHGKRIMEAEMAEHNAAADGSYTKTTDTVCAVLTADCLPVLLCDRAGTTVGAVHAGWRGLAAGVIEAGIAAMAVDSGELMAWIGPAIGPDAYAVGANVRDAMLAADPGTEACFQATRPGHWLFDMVSAARRRLANCGIESVYGGTWCTYKDAQHFFSYRRDHSTGRMATLIWIT